MLKARRHRLRAFIRDRRITVKRLKFLKSKQDWICFVLPLMFLLWQSYYACFYEEYSQIFKVLPVLLVLVCVWLQGIGRRFMKWFVAGLLLHVIVWGFFFADSQTIIYYSFHSFSFSQIPTFVWRGLSIYFPRIIFYITALIVALRKSNITKKHLVVLCSVGVVCGLLLLWHDMSGFISQILNNFNLFYLLLDYLLMWTTELGYWIALILFITNIQKHVEPAKLNIKEED